MGGLASGNGKLDRESQPSEAVSCTSQFPQISFLTCKRLVAVGSGGGDITKGVDSAVEGGESAAAASAALVMMATELEKINFEFPRAIWTARI